MLLRFKKVNSNVISPSFGTLRSSGLDIYTNKKIIIWPLGSYLYPSGIKFDIPTGYDLDVNNKSGVCTKKKIIVGANLIDEDYIGEVHIHLFNLSWKFIKFNPGDKLAQLVMRPVAHPRLIEVSEINKHTERGEKGFGSTDKK